MRRQRGVAKSCAIIRRIAHWLLVLTLSLSIGLQWAVVQGAAWVGMIVTYSQENSISRSLTMTFDGNHPCEMCQAAQQGESSQKKQNSEKPQDTLVLAAPETEPFIFARRVPVDEPDRMWAVVVRSQAPPLPPPKVA